MNLLTHPLIQKYFSPAGEPIPSCCMSMKVNEKEIMALRILTAMQEPIAMYEKALYTHDEGKTWQVGAVTGVPFEEGSFHPTWLRLPSRFQPIIKDNPMECGCRTWRHEMCHKPPKQECKCCKHCPGGLECRCGAFITYPNYSKPSPSKVEDEIDDIGRFLFREHGFNLDGVFKFEKRLRDLVRLAKEEK